MGFRVGGGVGPFRVSAGLGGGLALVVGVVALAGVAVSVPTLLGVLPVAWVGSVAVSGLPKWGRWALCVGVLGWLWGYLPLAVVAFWGRGAVMQAGVIVYGLVAAALSAGVVVQALKAPAVEARELKPIHPPTPLRKWCHRHPHLDTKVGCGSCGRWICSDCQVPGDEGVRCPECVLLARYRPGPSGP